MYNYHLNVGEQHLYPGFASAELPPTGYVFPSPNNGPQSFGMMNQSTNALGIWGQQHAPEAVPMHWTNHGEHYGYSGIAYGGLDFPPPRLPNFPNYEMPRATIPSSNGYSVHVAQGCERRLPQNHHSQPYAGRGRHGNKKRGYMASCGTHGIPAKGDHVKEAISHGKDPVPSVFGDKEQRSSIESCGKRCVPCDKSFNSVRDLQCHEKTHVQCESEGCNFYASRKLVNLHFIQNHAEGKFRIRLFTDEDIKAWREERRRNYPTMSNVKRRMEVEEKKRATGAVLVNAEFKYVDQMNSRRNGRNRHNGGFKRVYKKAFGRHQGENESGQSSNRSGKMCSEEREEKSSKCNLKDNVIHGKPERSSLNSSKSVAVSDTQMNECEMPDKSTPNALQVIGISYSSDETEKSNDGSLGKDANDTHGGTLCKTNRGGKETTDDTNHQAQPALVALPLKDRNQMQNSRPKSEHLPVTHIKRRPTLLEMLLANDIRRERNMILQCVRHIVKRNFFDCELGN